MKDKKLKAALYYLSLGFSVIPVSQDKKPLIDWKRYQEELPTEAVIRRWWSNWPDANIGLICGKISGIDVLDIDSEEGLDMVISEYLPDPFANNAFLIIISGLVFLPFISLSVECGMKNVRSLLLQLWLYYLGAYLLKDHFCRTRLW